MVRLGGQENVRLINLRGAIGVMPELPGIRLMMADEAEASVVLAGAAQQTYMATALTMDSYLVFEAAVRAGPEVAPEIWTGC